MSDPKTPLTLAIDIGTSRIKTAVFESDGRILKGTTGEAAQAVKSTPDGGLEMDPQALRRTLRAALDFTLSSSAVVGAPIAAVGVSCFWHGLLGLDREGRPLTPVYTWADSRCRVQAEKLRHRFSEAEVQRRTGCMLRSSFWPAKLLWLKEATPSLFASVRRWVSPIQWLEADFCGSEASSVSMVSATGLFNPTTCHWDRELLAACSIDESHLGAPNDTGRRISRRIWKRHPSLKEAVWFPSIGDGAAGNLGSGAIAAGTAAINLGTSSAVRVLCDNGPVTAPLGLFHYLLDGRRCLVGGASSNAGNLWKWCLDRLRLPKDGEALEAALSRRRRPLHGLTVLPFWTAERAPFWEEFLPGVMLGLRQSTTSLDIVQACLEAAYYRVALILERLEESRGGPLQVIVSGGGGRSRRTLRRLADALGRPVFSSGQDEASLRGAAVYAMERLGFGPPPLKPKFSVPPDRSIAVEHLEKRKLMLGWEERLGALWAPKQSRNRIGPD